MRYALIGFVFLAGAMFEAFSLSAVQQSFQEAANFAPLLTPHFGIVTEVDRKRDLRSDIPFLPTPARQYFYWQCLKLDDMHFACPNMNRAGSGMGCRRNSCIPELQIFSNGNKYTFITHQVWCVEDYRDLKAEVLRLLHREKTACFGGEYIEEDPPEAREVRRASSWFLKRIRTAHGKWDYFPD